MKSSDAFPRKYLASAEVKAKPIIARVSAVEMETVGQGADQKEKPVLYLDGQRPVVLNRTNFETLEEAFGDSDNWPGHKVKVLHRTDPVPGQGGGRHPACANHAQAEGQSARLRRDRRLIPPRPPGVATSGGPFSPFEALRVVNPRAPPPLR